jgi:hypothetical protein
MKAMEWVFALVLLALAAGCSDNHVSPLTEGDREDLENAPESITASGKTLVLHTYLWRDFMPESPPDGKPLIGLFYITVSDSTDYPAEWKADAVWLLSNDEFWAGGFTDADPAGDQLRRYRDIATVRDGPKYGPGIAVDAVVRLVGPAGERRYLKSPDQWINRTD